MGHSSSGASRIIYVFVCVLLISNLSGVETPIISLEQASSYLEASSASPSAPHIKYDVFISFRGLDIRQGFLSHLVKALSRKHIAAFVDTELERGGEISQELLAAIERSLISLVIFSKDYAFSHWCLEELVKIMECRKEYGQIVLPVFYNVDPSDLQHQKGTFANAFTKQEKRYNMRKVQSWRSALKESANLSGLHSSKFGTHAELVEEIIQSVMTRLKHMDRVQSKGLLGIGKPIAHVESLIRQEPENVSVIGIWSMDGVRKTAIAEEVFNQLRFEYEGSAFLANIKEESNRHGIISLKNKLFSTLLGEDLQIGTENGLPDYVRKRIGRMKVLIVLDDINESQQLEILVGTREWFGSGSRIIVTIRDRQVLAKDAIDTYKVEPLNSDDAFRLFSFNAFNQNHVQMEFHELSKRVEEEASSASPPIPHIKYDVFTSFRGSDIRKRFHSHLVKELGRKQIVVFQDTSDLTCGCEISRELLVAIERSLISLVIFSKDYASSHWCLEELVKIMECRKEYGQIVLPVFYEVYPSDVRHQNGTFANAFAKQEKRYDMSKVQRWRSALRESANLSGFHSSNFQTDAELIEEIIQRVMTRLKHMNQVQSKGLFGIGKPIAQVESLIRQEPENVSVIGIWGMGGIGKTTIAEEVFNQLRSEYEGSVFLANAREESNRNGIISLKNKLFSTLLGEDLQIGTQNGLPDYVRRRIGRMKVLIVLDDVNESQQLEILVGTCEWFGSGSRIIVTTRDRQVLAKDAVDTYKVQPLNSDDAFRLFSFNAFKQDHLQMEFHELSKRVVNYAKGIPLVLKVWGHHLHGKDKQIWESRLEKLGKMPNKKVLDMMRLSYDDLDHHEKAIFLDIACFFDGMNLKVNYLKNLLKDVDFSVVDALERLEDIACITISDENVVKMHDIVQETAWAIVRQESVGNPGNHSRIWDPDDIYQVLKNNLGTEAIRSITFNFSEMAVQDMQLSPCVFSKMSKLRFLDFYVGKQYLLHFPQGLQLLPNGLRYLRWMHYPLKSLPTKFSAENLVILDLPHSQVERLWHGVQNLVNLKFIKLSLSIKLKELPDLSKATNLEEMYLKHCVGLTHVHPSVFSINKLETLDLSWCTALTSLRSSTHLISLRYLSLYGCTGLEEFSVTSENMVELDLRLTSSIQSLPSSIGHLSKLEKLHLANSNIRSMPTSIKDLTSLKYLDISDCKNLQTLPELPSSIETLDADNCTSLKTVLFPSTIAGQLKENKKRVVFWNCLKLDKQFLKDIALNVHINIVKFANQYLSALASDYVANSNEDYDAEASYVYPGSTVPHWLEYRTTTDNLTIDLSSAPYARKLGFILCFIVPTVPLEGFRLIFTINDDQGEGSSVKVYMEGSRSGLSSDHVCLLYDQRCSSFLNNKGQTQRRFKIKVLAVSLSRTSEYVPVQLKGFGVHPVNPLEDYIFHLTNGTIGLL